MKNNNLIIVGGLALAAFFFMKKQTPPPPPPPDPNLPAPPTYSAGELSISEKLDALKYYSDNNRRNYGPALERMSDTELLDLYSYTFEYQMSGKRIPTWLIQRVNLIRLKYGFTL